MQLKTKVVVGTGLAGLALAAYVSVIAATKFVPNDQPIGYIGQPAMSNINVASGNEWMYSIDYSYKDWSGNLHSYNITKAGAVGVVDRWGTGGAAAKVLAQANAGTRNIVTLNSAGSGGTPFTWAGLSSAQKTMIDPGATEAMVKYLRGDKSNEGTAAGKYRVRAGGLGDIIHSTPVVAEDSAGNKTVFIGANDGMLHAINAVDGSERFAYVPGAVLGKLKLLTEPTYEHQYYVDGRMDHMVYNGVRILVGTLGAGGKAVFGLDVTNLGAMSEAKAAGLVKWEVSNATTGFGDLGYTYGAPTLTNLRDAAPSTGVHPALVMGNGYSNSGSGHAVLYLINPLTGGLLYAFDTEEGSTDAPNGLSAPSLWDLNKDGVKDVAYAGDLNGNLWRFSLQMPYTKPTKLYSGSGGAHAITMAPAVSHHPQGGAMVSFVTGRILTKQDMTDTSVHAAYGIWDGAPEQNKKILEQTLTEGEFGPDKIRVRSSSNNPIDFKKGQYRGWRTELPIGGERIIGDGAYTTAGVFQFMSHNPTINPGATPPGENWWMQLDALSGGTVGRVIFDLNADGVFTSQDNLDNGAVPVGRFMGGGVRSQLVALSVGKFDVFHSNFDRNGEPARNSSTTDTVTVGADRGVTGGHFDTDIFCYQNCGRFKFNKERSEPDWDYRNRNDDDGYYSVGYGQDNAGGYLNYIHVHEYDDIYDTVGLNMLNPSQDLQRLNLARATFVATHTPNTPKHMVDKTWPSNATLVSTSTSRVTQAGTPTPWVVYSTTLPDVVGTPVAGTNNLGEKTITTTTTYRTTAYYTYPKNARSYGCGKDTCWRYDSVREVYSWDTTTVTVDTIKNVRFKVLMANQAYSPAVRLSVEGDVGNSAGGTFNDSVLKYQTGNTLSAGGLPVYDMNTIRKLMWSMPLDAFNEKDWAGTGDVRTGLHPIQPPCAGVNTDKQTLGGGGEWRNGALTVQVVQEDTTDADIERNHPHRADLGYRLKPASQAKQLVAEYLIYWHHPNAKCHGADGFDSTPGADTTPEDAKPGKPAFGAADPEGEFKTVPGKKLETPKDPPPTVVKNPDGSTTTTTITYQTNKSGDGFTQTTKVTTTYEAVPGGGGTGIVTGGAVNTGNASGGGAQLPPGPDPSGITKTAASEGRLNWRELRK